MRFRWRSCVLRLPILLALPVCVFSAVVSSAPKAERPHKVFNLPADEIERSLKRFSEQSGLEVLFPTDAVAGVRTRAVRGDMTPREALDGILAGTGLEVVQDTKTGAFTVRREGPRPKA